MEDQTHITVDGREMHVPKGTLLWEACKDHGIDIPIFCYHSKLGPVGACRTCLVEVEGMTKGPITACSTPVTDGMVVRTRSPIVEKAQRGIFEFLLANHPLDCPICDRAGECPLQDQTFAYGPGTSRYVEPKRHHVKPVPIGPTIALDRERCVLCWRCVRFTQEIAEDKSIVLLDRGEHTVVGTFHDEPYVSNFSGNVVELCPVGALTSRKQRFNFRPWELRNQPSICPHCPVGCNINISVRKNDEVIRFLSRDNPQVDDSWLCDRGRYNYEFINSPERISSPMIRRATGFEQVSWDEALEYISERLLPMLDEAGPHAIAGIASPRLTNEDLFIFKRFMGEVLGTSRLDHDPRPHLDGTEEVQAATRSLSRSVTSIESLEQAKTIVLLGADPSEREPVVELRLRKAINRNGARLVVVSPDETSLSAKASVLLRYERAFLANTVRNLTSALAGSATDDAGVTDIVALLGQGPVVVLYDDTFAGIVDKGDALLAVSHFVDALESRGQVGVLPMLDDCNSMGARDLQIFPEGAGIGSGTRSVVADLLDADSQIRAAFVMGSNIAAGVDSGASEVRLRRLDLLVVSEMFMTETAKLADVLLPAASFAEKTGTFTNTERRVQRVHVAVPSPGMARPEWQMLVDLSQYFNAPLDYASPSDIWDDIRRRVPEYADIDFVSLGSGGLRAAALQPA